MTIEAAARKLAFDTTIIDGYIKFDEGERTWFFTYNASMKGATSRPRTYPNNKTQFNSWWKGLYQTQRKVIYNFGKFWWTNIEKISADNYDDIKKAYDAWPLNCYATDYGVEGTSCNLFVGEALHLHGRKVMRSGKYYSAHDIWEGIDPYRQVSKDKVKPGHIAAFGGTHVEIVTQVNHKANTFCSIGAGRGDGSLLRSGDGIEVCGWQVWNSRYIDAQNIKFLSI